MRFGGITTRGDPFPRNRVRIKCTSLGVRQEQPVMRIASLDSQDLKLFLPSPDYQQAD
jgi:hypothetical protein